MTRYRSKFGNKKVETYDGTFDSKKEYKRWCELKLMEKGGAIQNLQRQVVYPLIPKQEYEGETIRKCDYIADFVYTENGKTIVEDAKGVKTDAYKIKKKLMLYLHGVMIRET